MAFWSTQTSEPLRQYRWVVNFGADVVNGGTMDDLIYALKSVNKPKAKIGETTHKHLNHFYYYPGRLEWEAIEMTFAAVTAPSATNIINNVLLGAGYGVPTGVGGYNNNSTIGKRKFNGMLGRTIDIMQLNPDGGVIERWTLANPFFTNITFGDLNYENEGIVEIKTTVRYDWAKLGTEAGNNVEDNDTNKTPIGFP